MDQPLDFSKSSIMNIQRPRSLSISSSCSSFSESSPTSPSCYGINRKKGKALPDSLKDAAYWERRIKNNEAARKSREARRAKEQEIADRAVYYEQENLMLRERINQLESENHQLACVLKRFCLYSGLTTSDDHSPDDNRQILLKK
ncbi:thyrotroph embryonic factor-like [Brevipalpus obovatus]|uniref:thyrotroph embryonic factor-like n=1 Tax=Brevipalpus obovatus TaxID=246614 RepID=UPI003D9E2854